MKASEVTILAAIAMTCSGVLGCAKGGDATAASPERGQPQVLGVGNEQQDASLAMSLKDQAAAGKPERVEVHARYALALKCPLCAPIILANASGSPRQGSYLLPMVRDGEANPADYEVVGEFRIVGHYSGVLMPLGEWMRRTGSTKSTANPQDAHLRTPYLVFEVDHWCYVPSKELPLLEEQAPTDDFSGRMVKIIHQLRDDGHFCESEETE